MTRGVVLTAAAVATTAAWLALAGASWALPHHHAEAPDLAAFVLAVAMWQAMIVAMMTPTVLPWITAYGSLVASAPGAPPVRHASGAFAAGYFLVWLGYGAAAGALQLGLASLGLFAEDRVGEVAGGLILVAAGAYQFAPVKAACLTHCRSPLSYFLAHWQDGPVGGLRMGLAHGAYCLGCCWLVMLTALAMGVMNLAWMAVLTVIVVLEQTAAAGPWMSRLAGGALTAWGLWLLG